MRTSTLFRRTTRHPVQPHVSRQLTKPVREICVPPVDSIVEFGAYIQGQKVVAPGTLHDMEQSEHPWIREYFLGPRGRAAAEATSRANAGGAGEG